MIDGENGIISKAIHHIYFYFQLDLEAWVTQAKKKHFMKLFESTQMRD